MILSILITVKHCWMKVKGFYLLGSYVIYVIGNMVAFVLKSLNLVYLGMIKRLIKM